MIERMTLTVQENPDAHRYEAVDESGVVAGFVDYHRYENTRVIVHTEVDDAFEGQGVGSTLAREVIEQSLDGGYEVEVTCPFVKEWVERHPEYADRVALRPGGA